jgi:hypothetical protein
MMARVPPKKKKAQAVKTEWLCGVCENHNRCDYTYCKSCNIAKGALGLDK